MRIAIFLSLLLVTSPATSEPSAATAALYQSHCSVCHGDAGDGASHANQGLTPAAKNFTTPEYEQTASREAIASSIRNGKPGTVMIAWNSVLSSQDIDKLADYIFTSFVAPANAPDRSEASILYQENCSVCHGDDGMGAVWGQQSLASTPRNFRSEASRRELNRERMIAAVRFGRPGTPMPGFATRLESTQIEAIVEYVQSTFMAVEAGQSNTVAKSDHSASGDYHSQPLPDGLVGNPARGNSFYASSCVECHGIDGSGDGPRAYFIFPRPRNFLDPATREIFNRPRLFDGIKQGVIGKEMPAWGKVLNDQDIADITEYVYGAFIRPSE